MRQLLIKLIKKPIIGFKKMKKIHQRFIIASLIVLTVLAGLAGYNRFNNTSRKQLISGATANDQFKMSVIEVSPEKTPERFFLPRDTGELDENGNPIIVYDLDNLDVSEEYDSAKAFRRKSETGTADMVFKGDRIELRDGENKALLAEAFLTAEILNNNVWQAYDFNFDNKEIEKINDYTFKARTIKDIPELNIKDAVFELEATWTRENAKQTFYFDAPGKSVRIVWQVKIYDGFNNSEGKPLIKYDVEDYPGEVSHTETAGEGYTSHSWTFEPDGFKCPADNDSYSRNGLEVDPYMYAVEDGSTWIIYGDGWKLQFSENNYYTYRFYPLSGSEFCEDDVYLYYNSAYYYLYHNNTSGNTFELIEDTPQRIVFRIKGDFRIPAGNSLSTDAGITSEITYTYYIYPDRMFIGVSWYVSGNLTLTNSNYNSFIIQHNTIADYVTNELTAVEASGVEDDNSGAGYTYVNKDTAKYHVGLADEANIQGVYLGSSSSNNATYYQYVASAGDFNFGLKNGTLDAGIHKFYAVLIVDSASREHGSKLYTSVDRLAMGDQYKDTTIA
ncbi:hypothetical protein KKI23_01610, partial [Patescibacteria group bacterium]|nr:hypothetical protein [Patescibacteria group bacterium]